MQGGKNMDIRIINSKGEIVNATTLSIMVSGSYLIGLTEDSKQVLIEACRSEEESIAYLDAIKDALKVGYEGKSESILIDLEGKSEYKCCGKCKNCKEDD